MCSEAVAGGVSGAGDASCVLSVRRRPGGADPVTACMRHSRAGRLLQTQAAAIVDKDTHILRLEERVLELEAAVAGAAAASDEPSVAMASVTVPLFHRVLMPTAACGLDMSRTSTLRQSLGRVRCCTVLTGACLRGAVATEPQSAEACGV